MTKRFDDEEVNPGTIKIGGFKEPSTKRVKDIVDSDLNDLKATILQDDQVLKGSADDAVDPEVINKVLIPKIIQKKYPELTADSNSRCSQKSTIINHFKK